MKKNYINLIITISTDTNEEDNEEELIESEDEEISNEMDMDNNKIEEENSSAFVSNQNFPFNPNSLLNAFISTILNDDENFLQQTNKIEHIYNSINLIKSEAAQACMLITQLIQNNNLGNTISMLHLIELLKYLLSKPIEDCREELIEKLAELCFSLFLYLNNNQALELNSKVELINLIKDVLFKFKIDQFELCIVLSKILTLIAIKERNTNLIDGQFIIDVIITTHLN